MKKTEMGLFFASVALALVLCLYVLSETAGAYDLLIKVLN